MRIGSKLLLGFIPLVILTAMVAEVLYVNSQRISESSRRVQAAYKNYANILEMRQQEKNFSFYRENFYLSRLREASDRAAGSLLHLEDLGDENHALFGFRRAQTLLKEYQGIVDLLLAKFPVIVIKITGCRIVRPLAHYENPDQLSGLDLTQLVGRSHGAADNYYGAGGHGLVRGARRGPAKEYAKAFTLRPISHVSDIHVHSLALRRSGDARFKINLIAPPLSGAL